MIPETGSRRNHLAPHHLMTTILQTGVMSGIEPTIHAAQDNGAGAGDDLRHWREPEFDDMLPRRARIPGDTPPSGYDDDSDHGYPGNWADYYDFGSEHDDGDIRTGG